MSASTRRGGARDPAVRRSGLQGLDAAPRAGYPHPDPRQPATGMGYHPLLPHRAQPRMASTWRPRRPRSRARSSANAAQLGRGGRPWAVRSRHRGHRQRADVTVTRSVFERNQELQIAVESSDAVIESTSIRDALPMASDGSWARVALQDRSGRATLTLRESVVAGCRETCVAVMGSDATLESVAIRDATGRASDQTFGSGVSLAIRVRLGAPRQTRRYAGRASNGPATSASSSWIPTWWWRPTRCATRSATPTAGSATAWR